MARITVEDCLKMVDNQFDLVLTAAKRARRLANGAEPLVEWENDKPTVVALREIAAGLINDEILAEMSQPEDDILSSEEAEELLASTPMPGSNTRSMPAGPSLAAAAFASAAPAKPVSKPAVAAADAQSSKSTDELAAQIAAEFASAMAPKTEDAPLFETPATDAPAEPASDETEPKV